MHYSARLVLTKLSCNRDFKKLIGLSLAFSFSCELGYAGVRCEHFYLTVQQPLSKEYVALTVILALLVVLLCAGSVYYFWRW